MDFEMHWQGEFSVVYSVFVFDFGVDGVYDYNVCIVSVIMSIVLKKV